MEHPLRVAWGRGAPPSLDISNRPIWSACACFYRPLLPTYWRTISPYRHGRGLTGTGWRSRDGSGCIAQLSMIGRAPVVLHPRAVRLCDACNHGPFGRRQREGSLHRLRRSQAERAGVSGLGPNGAQRSAHAKRPTRGPKGTHVSVRFRVSLSWLPTQLRIFNGCQTRRTFAEGTSSSHCASAITDGSGPLRTPSKRQSENRRHSQSGRPPTFGRLFDSWWKARQTSWSWCSEIPQSE